MNTNHTALQDAQSDALREQVMVELSEAEILLIAGGTAIVNTI